MSEQIVDCEVHTNGDIVLWYFGKCIRIKAGVVKHMSLEEVRTII